MAPRKKNVSTTKSGASKSKTTKPVIQTGTWVVLILFVIAIVTVIAVNKNAETTAEAEITPTAEEKFVFDSSSPVKSIQVQPTDGETVKIERSESAWAVTQPLKLEADAGLAEAAASQVSALKIVQEIDGNPSDFGLDAPSFIITVAFENGNKNVLEVGDSTITNSGYYVRVDGEKILVLTLSGIDSLTTLVDFPPYLATPTPTATPLPPTETLVPSIEATPTP